MIALARVEGRGAYAARLLSRAVAGGTRAGPRASCAGSSPSTTSSRATSGSRSRRSTCWCGRRCGSASTRPGECARRCRWRWRRRCGSSKSLAPRAAGLVNAVLRRAVEEPWPDPADRNVPLSLRTSHPEWLVRRWVELLGENEAAAALAADQEPAPLCLLEAAERPRAARRGRLRAEAAPARARACSSWPAVRKWRSRRCGPGKAYAIDPAAVAVARLLPPAVGLTVDLAAAPGGKSLVLASERPGIRLLACRPQPRPRAAHAGQPGAPGAAPGPGRGGRGSPRPFAGQLPGGAAGRPVLGHRDPAPPPRDPLAPAARRPRGVRGRRSGASRRPRRHCWRPAGCCSTPPAPSSPRRTRRCWRGLTWRGFRSRLTLPVPRAPQRGRGDPSRASPGTASRSTCCAAGHDRRPRGVGVHYAAAPRTANVGRGQRWSLTGARCRTARHASS